MTLFIHLIFFLFLLGCGQKTPTVPIKTKVDLLNSANSKIVKNVDLISQNTEYFTDSLQIAVPGMYKIVLQQKSIDTITKVTFILFRKEKNTWQQVQQYELNKDVDFPLDAQIEDFNNDGCNDFTISYAAAGYGSNELRKLFVFTKEKEQFTEIKNSDYYSNLGYNSKLDCIYSLGVYGSGCTTSFLKVEKDTLQEFAGVDYDNETRTARGYRIKNGKQVWVSRKKIKDTDPYFRFYNFNPIEW